MSKSSRFRKHTGEDGVYIAPWERAFTKVLTPFEEFIHAETSSGILLMFCTAVALVLANSPMAPVYEQFVTDETLKGLVDRIQATE